MKRLALSIICIFALASCRDDKPEVTPMPPNEAIKHGAPAQKIVPAPPAEEPAESYTPPAPSSAGAAVVAPPTPPRPATISAPEPEWFEKEDVGTIEIIQQDDPIKQRYEEALELLEIGKTDQAIALLSENAKEAPDDAVNHWNLASVHLALEQGEAALPPLRKALELDADNIEYAVTLAGVELVMGNTSAAEALLEKLSGAHPEIADVHYQLGLLHVAAGRTEPALIALKEATKLDPKHPEAWTRLAILYVEAQSWPQALAAVEAVQGAGDTDAAESVEFLHGQVLAKLGRCEDAAKVLTKARDVGQADLADLAEGECWLGKSLPDQALPLLRAAAARSQDCQPCQMFLGDTLFLKAEWGAAADAYRAAAGAEPEDWRSRRQAGKCLLNLQRPKDAVPLLEAGLKIAPNDVEAWELLGHAYVASGNRPEAWTVMERLEKLGATERAKTVRLLLTK